MSHTNNTNAPVHELIARDGEHAPAETTYLWPWWPNQITLRPDARIGRLPLANPLELAAPDPAPAATRAQPVPTALTPETIVTPAQVVELVGGRQQVVRQWLRQAVIPLGHPTGRTVYLWGDVLAALRGAA